MPSCRADFIFRALLLLTVPRPAADCFTASKMSRGGVAIPHQGFLRESIAGESLKMLTVAFSYPQQWHVHNGPEWLGYTRCRAAVASWCPVNQSRLTAAAPGPGRGVMVADIATHLLGSLQ